MLSIGINIIFYFIQMRPHFGGLTALILLVSIALIYLSFRHDDASKPITVSHKYLSLGIIIAFALFIFLLQQAFPLFV